jgi:hypothetical protein
LSNNNKNKLSLKTAINAGLVSLGEPIMETILWHLHSRGFFIESNDIDITLFDYHLREVVGNVADNVLEEVYNTLEKQHSIYPGSDATYRSPSMSHGDGNSGGESIVYKIQQLLSTEASAKGGLSK